MDQPARRLSYAEIKQIEDTKGRFCRGCRTVYAPPDISTSFGADARTRDGLTLLCLTCIAKRDAASATRQRGGRADSQTEYRSLRRDMLLGDSQVLLDEYLAHDPPEHAIPLRAMPGYPPTPSNSRLRTPQESAALTLVYGLLRESKAQTWEQIAGNSRQKINTRIWRLGPRSFATIDEHLRAFDLEPLKP